MLCVLCSQPDFLGKVLNQINMSVIRLLCPQTYRVLCPPTYREGDTVFGVDPVGVGIGIGIGMTPA